MRHLSLAMLDKLRMPLGARCLDLTCGTGFVTGELARRGGSPAIGVDASAGMLEQARSQHPNCQFIQSEALEYLRRQPKCGFDLVTCAWGLGYTRPLALLRGIARVLRPGGQLGIIDNSLFSVAEVLWSSPPGHGRHRGRADRKIQSPPSDNPARLRPGRPLWQRPGHSR